MKTSKEQKYRNLIEATEGRIFSVCFTKMNGTIRNMVCRTGVKKHLKGKGRKITDDNLIIVFDMQKKEYRSFKLDRINYINFRGVQYAFNDTYSPYELGWFMEGDGVAVIDPEELIELITEEHERNPIGRYVDMSKVFGKNRYYAGMVEIHIDDVNVVQEELGIDFVVAKNSDLQKFEQLIGC